MDRQKRRELKNAAWKNIKKHYWLLVCICLIAAILGTDFSETLTFLKMPGKVAEVISEEESTEEEESNRSVITAFGMDQAYQAVLEHKGESYKRAAEKQDMSEDDIQIGILQVGHEEGVLASGVNMLKNGMLYIILYDAFKNITGSKDMGIILFLFFALFVMLFFYIFIVQIYEVIMVRILLETRVYEKVPIGRFLYLVRVKRWFKVTFSALRKTIYQLLWDLTIVGGVIKQYSYFCVPFILAENPDCKGKDAILLSRKMMYGHKWECFVFQLSFILWDLLNMVTFGAAGLFFVNPYKINAFTEYYTYLRNCWIEKQGEGYELLNDKYLYEKADQELLYTTYEDIDRYRKMPLEEPEVSNKIVGFFARNFGVILKHDEKELEYLKVRSIQQKIYQDTLILEGKMYPGRLFPIPEKDKIRNLEGIGFLRSYSLSSIIMMFFSMCIIGWLWEVSLHLIGSGEFVNRGVFHGPWLPIYGTGGIIIMLLLNRFRRNPALHLFLGMVLAGIVEYGTGWYLETFNDGMKWWDYSGYFLNLHGRVCAEGLLVFGFGGMAIVYIVAPILDNQFRKIPNKIAVVICAVLLVSFIGDAIYSSKHPNEGDGITNNEAEGGCIITSNEVQIPYVAYQPSDVKGI